mmetsp:Transcript_27784/g.82940  ORF Transcript_27784/g.82940 Transcript_27784/m.82940 type:complete len:252 (-) Transcript_27784:199-954(-)
MPGVPGAWYDGHVVLDRPTQQHLGPRLAVRRCDGRQLLHERALAKRAELSLLAAEVWTSQGGKGRDNNSALVAPFDGLVVQLRHPRVILYLVDGNGRATQSQQPLHPLRREIAHAEVLDQARVLESLKRQPRLLSAPPWRLAPLCLFQLGRCWSMQENKVEVTYVSLLEHLGNGLCHVTKAVHGGGHLCGVEDLLARHPSCHGVPDALPHLLGVLVDMGPVEVAPSHHEEVKDGLTHSFTLCCWPATQTQT